MSSKVEELVMSYKRRAAFAPGISVRMCNDRRNGDETDPDSTWVPVGYGERNEN
jgi:hypothetical protein